MDLHCTVVAGRQNLEKNDMSKPKFKYEIQSESNRYGRIRGFPETSFPEFQEKVNRFLDSLEGNPEEDTIIIRKVKNE